MARRIRRQAHQIVGGASARLQVISTETGQFFEKNYY